MKTLKITLTLLAVALLTVSGMQSENAVVDNEPTYNEQKSYDLLAHSKKKLKTQGQG